MSDVSAPFGFVPQRHPTGNVRAEIFSIANNYATAINKYQPVIMNTNGTITAGAAASDLFGVFSGVEYVDASGKPVVSHFWPAGGVPGATDIRAYVWTDPNIEYLVQATGPVAQTAILDQTDVANIGNAANGYSQSGVSHTLAGAAAQGQFRVIGFDRSVDNVIGDAFTKVIVKIARHQSIANKVAV